jgi:O-antigen ligase
MDRKISLPIHSWGTRSTARTRPTAAGLLSADSLLRVVDVGLCGIICVAPFFFGGRHDVGRLIFVALVAVTAAAWFARQALLPAANWPRTAAYLIPLIAAGLLVIQLAPLPPSWLACIAPRTYELLPLWSPNNTGSAQLGIWRTISFQPQATAKSLAMLVTYGMLFAVLVGRIRDIADIHRLLKWMAISAASMAAFGIVQYFTSDGRFFWFYAHPSRTTTQNITGAFINRNHFAQFVILGLGPLAALLISVWRRPIGISSTVKTAVPKKDLAIMWLVAASIALAMFAVLGSRSRGGALVMLVAGAVLVAIYVRRGLADVRMFFGLVGLAVVVAALVSLYGYDHVTNRLDDLAEGSLEGVDDGAIRRKLWAANIAALNNGWLTGAGAGSHCQLCPVYLPESLTKEYLYAENGYLQIATETGIVGILLLAAAIACCMTWCVRCYRHAHQPDEIRAFGAAAAGLAASATHSVVDFVWYIPACMTGAIVLAACVCRLSQMTRATSEASPPLHALSRSRWMEICAASVLLGGWAVYVLTGPALAAIHWDRYFRLAVADRAIAQETMSDFVAGNPVASSATRHGLSTEMLRALQAVVYWDPAHARAHCRLADRYMAEFELRAAASANPMDIRQIADAAMASKFESAQALDSWLEAAFGKDVQLLRYALAHARRTVELCPLEGDAYVYLAELCFLNQTPRAAISALVDQGLRVRPYDRNVLTKAGLEELAVGRIEPAIKLWSRCFNTPGRHQQEIAYRLVAAGMPAQILLTNLRPEWQTLREVWAQYLRTGVSQDLSDLLSYAAELAQQEIANPTGMRPVFVWYRLAAMHADIGRPDESLAYLQRAHACDSNRYAVRYALAKVLLETGRFAESEPHVRWCLSRRPGDKGLRDALVAISKHRLAARTSPRSTGSVTATVTPTVPPSAAQLPAQPPTQPTVPALESPTVNTP